MHTPRATHMHAVKRIFRYLQGTLDYGLQLCPAISPMLIVAYSYADWAGCKDSCRSTTDYMVFFFVLILFPNTLRSNLQFLNHIIKSNIEL